MNNNNQEDLEKQEYHRICRLKFEDIIDSWKLPMMDIETDPERILKNLEELSIIGNRVFIDFDSEYVEGFDAVKISENYNHDKNLRIIKRNYEKAVSLNLQFNPKKMLVHKDYTNDLNYILLFTEEGAAYLDDSKNPETLIEKTEENGKKNIALLSSCAKEEDKRFYDIILNFFRENSQILIHPVGSLYSKDKAERNKLLERFKI